MKTPLSHCLFLFWFLLVSFFCYITPAYAQVTGPEGHIWAIDSERNVWTNRTPWRDEWFVPLPPVPWIQLTAPLAQSVINLDANGHIAIARDVINCSPPGPQCWSSDFLQALPSGRAKAITGTMFLEPPFSAPGVRNLWALDESFGNLYSYSLNDSRWVKNEPRRLNAIAADPCNPNALYSVDHEGRVLWQDTTTGTRFTFPGIQAQMISVGGEQGLWAIDTQGNMQRWLKNSNRWARISIRESNVPIRPNVIAVDPRDNNAIFFGDAGGIGWVTLDGLNQGFVQRVKDVGAPVLALSVELSGINCRRPN